MKNDEIEELISALHEAGVDAQLCDTSVRQALVQTLWLKWERV